jgi:hypothetical protein
MGGERYIHAARTVVIVVRMDVAGRHIASIDTVRKATTLGADLDAQRTVGVQAEHRARGCNFRRKEHAHAEQRDERQMTGQTHGDRMP